MTPQERFWQKVDKYGLVSIERPDLGRCWLWRGVIAKDGYGHVTIETIQCLVHVVTYEWLMGPVPEGLQLDHLCRVRNCVNPSHLEPVTAKVNTLRSPIAPAALNARKTHCPQGHEYSGYNVRIGLDGRRHCRTCKREWMREKRKNLNILM